MAASTVTYDEVISEDCPIHLPLQYMINIIFCDLEVSWGEIHRTETGTSTEINPTEIIQHMATIKTNLHNVVHNAQCVCVCA